MEIDGTYSAVALCHSSKWFCYIEVEQDNSRVYKWALWSGKYIHGMIYVSLKFVFGKPVLTPHFGCITKHHNACIEFVRNLNFEIRLNKFLEPILHTHQLHAFHKGYLCSICGYILKDKISNADVLQSAKMEALKPSWCILNWDELVMSSDWAIIKYQKSSCTTVSERNKGRPLFSYKDKLKSNLEVLVVPLKNFWADGEYAVTMAFEYLNFKAIARSKQSALRPAALSHNKQSCTQHGIFCKPPVKLKCHIWHKNLSTNL